MEKKYRKIFARNLLYYMEKFNKTQTDIVIDLDINKSAISTWCNGTRMPRMDKVQKLADYFGVNKSDLLEEHPAPEDEDSYYINEEARRLADAMHKDPRYQVLFDASRKVKPEDIEKVKRMIDLMRSDYDGDDPA